MDIALAIIFIICIIAIIVIGFLTIVKFNKKKIEIMQTKEKHRFKYIDTFYYTHVLYIAGVAKFDEK